MFADARERPRQNVPAANNIGNVRGCRPTVIDGSSRGWCATVVGRFDGVPYVHANCTNVNCRIRFSEKLYENQFLVGTPDFRVRTERARSPVPSKTVPDKHRRESDRLITRPERTNTTPYTRKICTARAL